MNKHWLIQLPGSKAGEPVVFEAALRSGFKYIRVDVLQITEHEIRVIEVKSKSVVGRIAVSFLVKRALIRHGGAISKMLLFKCKWQKNILRGLVGTCL